MGNNIKEQVQLVVSHLEGCSGNFLARLYADHNLDSQATFKVDGDQHPKVLAINGKQNLKYELTKLNNHIAVVTHNCDLELLAQTFPNAKVIRIYPYNKLGNVLWNISHKKLTTTMNNAIDNHIIHITEWKKSIDTARPVTSCADYADLTDQHKVESLLAITFNQSQLKFFNDYQSQQLPYLLNWPTEPCGIQSLIDQWAIGDWCNDWSIAFTICVFENINGYTESQRRWDIGQQQLHTWDDLIKLESQYRSLSD